MNVNWLEFLATPLQIVEDYRTVMDGEALALQRAHKGKPKSDVPPGFEDETVTEVIEF